MGGCVGAAVEDAGGVAGIRDCVETPGTVAGGGRESWTGGALKFVRWTAQNLMTASAPIGVRWEDRLEEEGAWKVQLTTVQSEQHRKGGRLRPDVLFILMRERFLSGRSLIN